VASSLFALGSFISSVLGTRLYNKFSDSKKSISILVLNIFNFIFPLLLHLNAAKVLHLSPPIALLILTLYGFSWALPFYIPAGIMALKLGGKKHSALLTNLFDAVGFLAASIFSYYATELGRVGNWAPIFKILASVGAVSAVSMSLAMKDRL